MNQKTTIVIFAAIVLVGAGIWLTTTSRRGGGGPSAESEPRSLIDSGFGEFESMEIAAPNRPAVAFIKQDGKWRITQPIQAPAAAFAVDGIAGRFRGLSYVLAFGTGDGDRPPESITRLDKPTRVKLTAAGGKAVVVKVGAEVPAARQTYVQMEGNDTVYVVSADLATDLQKSLNDYRDKRVAEFAVDQATRVEVTAEESYALVKGGEQWTIETPVRARADRPAVEALLRSLSNLNVTGFVDDAPSNLTAYGLAEPAVRIAVTGEKKTPRPAPATQSTQPAAPEFDISPFSVGLVLGVKTGDKRFAKLDSPEAPWVFQVPDSVVASLAPPLLSLRDKTLTKAAVDRAMRISVAAAGTSYDLIKKDGAWEVLCPTLTSLKSNAAEFAAVDELLRALREMKATGFEPGDDPLKDYGLANPRARLELSIEGAVEPVRLTVGSTTPSGAGAYVKNEGESAVAVVKAEDVDKLLLGPLDFVNRDLLRFERSRARRLELARGALKAVLESAAGSWRFTSPVTAEADSAAVNNLLTDLATLRARRMVAAAADAAKFGLDAPAATLRLTVDAPPKPAPTTTQSTQPAEPPSPPEVYALKVAKRDGKAFLLVDGMPTIAEVDARVHDNVMAELMKRDVSGVDATQVQSLTIARQGAAPFTFEKRGNNWVLVGEESFPADTAKIDAVLRAFATLRAERFVDYTAANLAAFDLAQPVLTVTVRTSDGTMRELRLSNRGPADDATLRHAVIVGSGGVFVIKGDVFSQLDKDVKSFQKS